MTIPDLLGAPEDCSWNRSYPCPLDHVFQYTSTPVDVLWNQTSERTDPPYEYCKVCAKVEAKKEMELQFMIVAHLLVRPF